MHAVPVTNLGAGENWPLYSMQEPDFTAYDVSDRCCMRKVQPAWLCS